MAGFGPPPKDPSQRARNNKPAAAMRTIGAERVDPYELPDDLLPRDDDGTQDVWHPATLRWWRRWCDSPLASNLTAVDWSELETTAVLHHEYMRKRSFTLASELRLRMAAFGATPADRLRLRILIVEADAKDPAAIGGQVGTGGARSRYGNLTVVPAAAGE